MENKKLNRKEFLKIMGLIITYPLLEKIVPLLPEIEKPPTEELVVYSSEGLSMIDNLSLSEVDFTVGGWAKLDNDTDEWHFYCITNDASSGERIHYYDNEQIDLNDINTPQADVFVYSKLLTIAEINWLKNYDMGRTFGEL